MKVAPMGEVRNNFGKYLDACREEPIFVTRNGRITAVIEPLDDSDIEDFLLERNPRFLRMLEKSKGDKKSMRLSEYRKTRGI